MPLHIDKRPNHIDKLIGNEGIKESIKSVFTREDKPHSVLLIGPSGCGKTTIARIIASMVGCMPEDVQEYNSSNTRGIDTIREIQQNSQFAPLRGKVKVYIIDECHKLTGDAQNAILKLLEDTPKHCYFLLCTTDPDKMLKAIRTRCMTFEVKSLAGPQLTKLVEDTIVSEGIPLTDFSKEVIKAIVKNADGCPRQALILLDSVIDIEDEETALKAVSEAKATEVASIDVCRTLLDTRTNRFEDIVFLLKNLNDSDEEKMRHSIRGYMYTVAISDQCKDRGRVIAILDCFAESYMYVGKGALLSSCYYACQI